MWEGCSQVWRQGIWGKGREKYILLGQSCVTPSCRMDGQQSILKCLPLCPPRGVAVQLLQGMGCPKAAPQCTEMSIGMSSFTGILDLTSLKLPFNSIWTWRTEMLQALGRGSSHRKTAKSFFRYSTGIILFLYQTQSSPKPRCPNFIFNSLYQLGCRQSKENSLGLFEFLRFSSQRFTEETHTRATGIACIPVSLHWQLIHTD